MIKYFIGVLLALGLAANCFASGPFSAGKLGHSGIPHDPYFSSVVFLANFTGANNSTTLTDVKGHTVTAGGAAKISTAQSLAGAGSSLYLDGASASNVVTSPSSADFGFAGDVTVEYLVYPVSYVSGSYWMQVSNNGLRIQKYSTTSQLGINNGLSWTFNGTALPSTGAWHHVAYSRTGSSSHLFIDGVDTGPFTNSTSWTSGALTIGDPSGTGTALYVQAVRITQGVNRYPANFTAPTSFPAQ